MTAHSITFVPPARLRLDRIERLTHIYGETVFAAHVARTSRAWCSPAFISACDDEVRRSEKAQRIALLNLHTACMHALRYGA